MLHSSRNSLLNFLTRPLIKVVQRLNNNKHVIHSNAKQEERYDRTHVIEGNTEVEAETVARTKRQTNDQHPSNGQERSLLDPIKVTEDEENVDEEENKAKEKSGKVGAEERFPLEPPPLIN